jgi:hypothetical protein
MTVAGVRQSVVSMAVPENFNFFQLPASSLLRLGLLFLADNGLYNTSTWYPSSPATPLHSVDTAPKYLLAVATNQQ